MEVILRKLAEDYGLAGIVIALGAFIAVRVSKLVLEPMVSAWSASIAVALAEVAEQRKERLEMCAIHRDHDDKTLQLLQGLMMSMEGLVRRANGG
jgi:hypothetical protein